MPRRRRRAAGEVTGYGRAVTARKRTRGMRETLGDPDDGQPPLHGHDVGSRDTEYRVAELLVLGSQGLRLGDCEPGDVSFRDSTEMSYVVPSSAHQTVGVEGEVSG